MALHDVAPVQLTSTRAVGAKVKAMVCQLDLVNDEAAPWLLEPLPTTTHVDEMQVTASGAMSWPGIGIFESSGSLTVPWRSSGVVPPSFRATTRQVPPVRQAAWRTEVTFLGSARGVQAPPVSVVTSTWAVPC